jgi:hypothetical protein
LLDGFDLRKEMKKIDMGFMKGEEFAVLDKDLLLRKPIRNEELLKQLNSTISQTK